MGTPGRAGQHTKAYLKRENHMVMESTHGLMEVTFWECLLIPSIMGRVVISSQMALYTKVCGLMITRMGKEKRLCQTAPSTKENGQTVRNTARVNTPGQMDLHTRECGLKMTKMAVGSTLMQTEANMMVIGKMADKTDKANESLVMETYLKACGPMGSKTDRESM